MFRSTLFLLLFLPVLTETHASCTNIFSVTLSEQQRYLSYQQRGLPRKFIKPFYKTFLNDLYKFAKLKYPSKEFGNICFTDSDLTEFFGQFHNRSAIDDKVAVLRARFPHIPYIPPAKKTFVPADERVHKASFSSFNKTLNTFRKHDFKTAASLPRTADVLYDPRRQKALRVYKVHASHGPKIRALKYLRGVTGMVVRLELMKVPRTKSIQLLRHAVAWLSTVFRALQKDGPNVKVPALYLPFYRHVAGVLAEGSGVDVPLVSDKVVKKIFGKALNVYTSVDAWGRLEVVNWENKMHIWTIEQMLFDPVILQKVALKIGFDEFDEKDHPPYDPDVEGLDGWQKEPVPDEDGDEEDVDDDDGDDMFKELYKLEKHKKRVRRRRRYGNSVRTGGEGMCEEPLYEDTFRQTLFWEERCCASICRNAALMMEASITTDECCNDCNQLDCVIESSRLESLAVVHLEPYGYDDGGAVPVSL